VIDFAVRSGAYQNPGEVLDIETGFAHAERGDPIDGDVAIEMLRKRHVERLKPEE